MVDRFAEPGAGLVPGRVGQFGEVVDGGFDDTHGSGSLGMLNESGRRAERRVCRELKKQKPGAGPGFCEAENEPYSAARASMSSAVSLK